MADEEVLYMKIDSNTGEVTKDVEKLDDATKKTSRSFGKLGNAVKSIGTGIKRAMGGIILGVLASFANALRQNQKIVDIFNVTLRTTSIALNDYLDF